MGALADVERFLERLFERPAQRLPAGHGRLVRLQRRIEREVEASRRRDGEHEVVSSRFRVRLHPSDLAGLGEPADSVATALAAGILDFVRKRGYIITDRPQIELVADPALVRGDIEVETAPEPTGTDNAAIAAAGTSTEVLANSPNPSATMAILRVDGPGEPGREVALDHLPLTIGRAHDNGLVLADREVSRHHARIAVQRGGLVLTDLGSTNGVRVNGRQVREVVLAMGDRITLGRTALVVAAGIEWQER
jgi:hypothetical protein